MGEEMTMYQEITKYKEFQMVRSSCFKLHCQS